jgi:signal transduction histidine kinase
VQSTDWRELRPVRAAAELLGDLSPRSGTALPPLPGGHRPLIARSPQILAVLLAVALAAITAVQTLHSEAGVSPFQSAAFGIAQGLPLVLAPFRPMAGFWMSLVVGMWVSETARHGGDGPLWSEPSFLVHLGVLAIAALGVRPRVLIEMWVLTLLAGAVLVQRMPGTGASADLPEMSVMSGVVLIVAGALRGRGEAQRRLTEQELIAEAERARRALLEERTRIARELHDVVAHHMSVIAIQAEAAPYRVADPPKELSRSFAIIRTNAVEALTELRRVLGVLRAEEPRDGVGGGGDGAGAVGPQPDLNRLDDLIANVRGTGLSVVLRITGERRALPPGVELSAYRIVQEALSNTMRHAVGAAVLVEVDFRPEVLELRVRYAAPPPPAHPGRPAAVQPAHGAGHGVVGMRERAAMLDGELTARPTPDGGYQVRAVLPVSEAPAAGGADS